MLEAAEERIEQLEERIEGMRERGWDAMMEEVRQHYPQDVAYFANSDDPGCRIIRTVFAVDQERKRAEAAEERARVAEERIRELEKRTSGTCLTCIASGEAEIAELRQEIADVPRKVALWMVAEFEWDIDASDVAAGLAARSEEAGDE